MESYIKVKKYIKSLSIEQIKKYEIDLFMSSFDKDVLNKTKIDITLDICKKCKTTKCKNCIIPINKITNNGRCILYNPYSNMIFAHTIKEKLKNINLIIKILKKYTKPNEVKH